MTQEGQETWEQARARRRVGSPNLIIILLVTYPACSCYEKGDSQRPPTPELEQLKSMVSQSPRALDPPSTWRSRPLPQQHPLEAVSHWGNVALFASPSGEKGEQASEVAEISHYLALTRAQAGRSHPLGMARRIIKIIIFIRYIQEESKTRPPAVLQKRVTNADRSSSDSRFKIPKSDKGDPMKAKKNA